MDGYPTLVRELEGHISSLQTGDSPVQFEAFKEIVGKCHHHAYGDALTSDQVVYNAQMLWLHHVGKKFVRQ